MRRLIFIVSGAAALAAAAAIGGGTAAALLPSAGNAAQEGSATTLALRNWVGSTTDTEGDEGPEGHDVPLTGSDLEKATAAAHETVGEGTVTETEVGDDSSAYEVEMLKADGTHVEVELDSAFNVLRVEADDND